jgi:hypothetical protein
MSLFKTMDFHVTPAYGRDYRNKAQALADWFAGKDFILGLTGQYLSKRDAENASVWIRYDKARKIIKAQ